jgi:hypothetical protein
MAFFSTARDEKRHDYRQPYRAQNHRSRLTGAFYRVKSKLSLREIADLLADCRARVSKIFSSQIIAENALLSVPTCHHVVKHPAIFDPNGSGHSAFLNPHRASLSRFVDRPLFYSYSLFFLFFYSILSLYFIYFFGSGVLQNQNAFSFM